MKKQTGLHSIKLLSLVICAAMAIILGATISISAQDQPTLKAGDRIEVESGGIWHKAKILEIKDGSYKINYDGYGSGSDEWVKADRMRSARETAPANKTTANQTNNGYEVGDRVELNSRPKSRAEGFRHLHSTFSLSKGYGNSR
jgi:hypothetical protein